MKFGIREVCDITFEKLAGNGPNKFTIDTAKMSTLESTSSTSYAQGGKGNSRLIAWEGEKTLTFTIEDALMSLASFAAVTGAEASPSQGDSTITYKVRTTSFAGYYKITATTFFRDENGVDHPATIFIPKAKLQTSLNLAMSPTGDPSAFTFTFDALPQDREDNLLFVLTINNLDPSDLAEVAGSSDGNVFVTIWYDNNGKIFIDKTWNKSQVVVAIRDKQVTNSHYIDGEYTTETKTRYTLTADNEEILNNFDFGLGSEIILDKTTLISVQNDKYQETLEETEGVTYTYGDDDHTVLTQIELDGLELDTIVNIPSTVTQINFTKGDNPLQSYAVAMQAAVTDIVNPLQCNALTFYGSHTEWEKIQNQIQSLSSVSIMPKYNPTTYPLSANTYHEIIIFAEEEPDEDIVVPPTPVDPLTPTT